MLRASSMKLNQRSVGFLAAMFFLFMPMIALNPHPKDIRGRAPYPNDWAAMVDDVLQVSEDAGGENVMFGVSQELWADCSLEQMEQSSCAYVKI